MQIFPKLHAVLVSNVTVTRLHDCFLTRNRNVQNQWYTRGSADYCFFFCTYSAFNFDFVAVVSSRLCVVTLKLPRVSRKCTISKSLRLVSISRFKRSLQNLPQFL